jgi:hypothetical protein
MGIVGSNNEKVGYGTLSDIPTSVEVKQLTCSSRIAPIKDRCNELQDCERNRKFISRDEDLTTVAGYGSGQGSTII